MEVLLIPGAIVLAGYLIAKEIRKNKNGSATTTSAHKNHVDIENDEYKEITEEELDRLKDLGNKYYKEALDNAIKTLKKREKKIEKNNTILPKEWMKDALQNAQKQLSVLESMGKMFVRLEEKFKHHSIESKYPIYRDWVDYNNYLNQIESNGKHLEYVFDNKTSDKIFDEIRELHLKAQEIEKRFEEKLKKSV